MPHKHHPALGLFAVILALLGVGATAGSAAAATAGPALVVTPGTIHPLLGGGSTTPFGLALPPGARCPGDSTVRPWYQVDSYLVPKGTNPATINFKALFPTPGLFLVAVGAPFEGIPVEKSTALVDLPGSFSLSRFHPSDLLPGGGDKATWEGGVACAAATGVASNYWNVEFTFTASATDPHGFTWTARPPTDKSSSGPSWLAVVGLVTLLVAAGLALRVYRGRDRERRPVGLRS